MSDSEERYDESSDEEQAEPTAYELERDANVARNNEVLESLGLADGTSKLTGKKNAVKGKDKAIRKKAKAAKKIHMGPIRASARLMENASSSAHLMLAPDPCLPPQPYDFYPNNLVREICAIAIMGIKRPDGSRESHSNEDAQGECVEEEEEVGTGGNEDDSGLDM